MAETIPVLQEDGSIRDESFDESAKPPEEPTVDGILKSAGGPNLGEPLATIDGVTLVRLRPLEPPKPDTEK